MEYIDTHKDSVEKWLAEEKSADVPPSVRAKHEWFGSITIFAISEYFRCPIGEEDEFIK